ncbi:MAG: amino acid permease [Planctomycetaceae bacterium]|nr:amino acid permease [Planctomycetaceae bacterium]
MSADRDAGDATGSATPSTEIATLPRVLGLFSAVTIVVGSIIGSGIFLKTGNVATALGSFGPIIGVWIGVGLVTLCGSLALAELAAMVPRAGGPYVYLSMAYGRLPAFLWGWTEFWVVRAGSLGALSCATAIYLSQVVPMDGLQQEIVAIAIVVGLSIINYLSTRWGASVQNVSTVVKVAFLGTIIVLPFLLGKTDVQNLDPVWPTSASMGLMQGIGIAMVAVLWPYDGWINIAPVAEEIREPHRNLPLGLGLGMFVVIVVYVGANISYHLTLPMEQVAGSKTIASDVFKVLFGETGAKIAALGVMCSTFGAVNSNMLTGPRIYFAMARDGLLPAAICRVHAVYQTPSNAIVIQAAWTTLLIVVFYAWKDSPKDAFDGLTDSVILGGLIFYSMTVAAVYVLRSKRPDLPRPYRTWGYPVTPALLLLAYSGALLSILSEHWKESTAVIGLIASGTLFYAWSSRQPRGRRSE